MFDKPLAKIFIATLGCAKNEVDSEEMADKLLCAGYCLVDEPDEADIAIVNTCSFIQAATEESLDLIFDISLKPHFAEGNGKIVVCGCMPSRYADELADELVEASAFVPCADEDNIVSIVDSSLGISRPSDEKACPLNTCSSLNSTEKENGEGMCCSALSYALPNKSWAYVKISDGCSRGCTYCTIPSIRGPYKSYSLEEIENFVDRQLLLGAKEIVLIGQDTGIWGLDLQPRSSLAELLQHLATKYPKTWFRVMYTQPEKVTDELLSVMANNKNVCSYLDIPFQHCSEHILKRMGRKGSKEGFLKLLSHIRTLVNGVTIRTTLMCGFPGESDEDFEQLVSFVEEAAFDYVGIFAYSREESTPSFDFDGQLDEDEKQWRAEHLRSVADALSSQVISSRVKSTVSVLVDGVEEDGQVFGRTMQQAPEVDGVTYILDVKESGDGYKCNKSDLVGSIVNATVSDTLMYDMEVEI